MAFHLMISMTMKRFYFYKASLVYDDMYNMYQHTYMLQYSSHFNLKYANVLVVNLNQI